MVYGVGLMPWFMLWFISQYYTIIGRSKGNTRDARPLGGPNSFIFMQFPAINRKIIGFWELAPPPGPAGR